MKLFERIRKPFFASVISVGLLAGIATQAMAAPLYKDTLVVAGVFPGVSYQAALLKRVSDLGFTRARIDLPWQSIERTKGVYDWSYYDNIYSQLMQHGQKQPIFILAYNNRFYGPSSPHPKGYQWGITNSGNRDAFARFARAAAAHWKGKGIIWEVWNEQDVQPFWADTPSPTEYAKLANATVSAIRAADPNAYIVSGGFAKKYDQKEFIRQSMAAGMLKGLNALAIHSYDVLNPPRTLEMQEELYNEYRNWMKQYNNGNVLPIIDTEFGMSRFWGSQWNSADPDDARAKRYVRMYLDNYYSQVWMSSVYGLNDTAPNGQPGDFSLYNDSKMTRALVYSNKLLGELEGTNLTNYPSGVRAILFKKPGSTTPPPGQCTPTAPTTGGGGIIAMWASQGAQRGNLPEKLNASGVYDVYGNQILGERELTTYTLDENIGPVFIVLK